MKDCPKCGEPMELVDDDPDTGIIGGWDCTSCGHVEHFDYADFDFSELDR